LGAARRSAQDWDVRGPDEAPGACESQIQSHAERSNSLFYRGAQPGAPFSLGCYPSITAARLTFLPLLPQAPYAINQEGDLAVNHVDGVWGTLLPRRLRGPFEARERWRQACLAQFEAFPRAHPRSLEQRPRITRKSGHREWVDTTLGSWPANTVAKAWTRG